MITMVVVATGIVLAAASARAAVRRPARTVARRRLTGWRCRRLGPGLAQRWRAARAQRSVADGLVAVLDDVARGVRSGSSLQQACAEASTGDGAARAGLAEVVGRADRGLPLAAAFAGWATATPSPDVRVAAAALALAASAGGPQARAVDGVAATLRERRAVAGDVGSQSAQARLSAVVVGLLPLAFLLWALATDRRTAAFLVSDRVGWLCLASGVALEAAGALWMRRILRAVVL
jgi:tight adherence protein B